VAEPGSSSTQRSDADDVVTTSATCVGRETAAATAVASQSRALATRPATCGGTDLRGPAVRTTRVLAVAVAAGTLAHAHPCRAQLPAAPAVPAAIVFRTSCGGFLLEPGRRLTRLPRHWFAVRSGGTGRRWGAHLNLRRDRPGRIFLSENGRLIWRSHNLYPNDGGTVAFGRHRFAFASYRRGIFITDLHSAERLVLPGRGLFPDAFTDTGELIVNGGSTLTIIDANGRVQQRLRYRVRSGFAFNEGTQTLYFVSRNGVLTQMRGKVIKALGKLASADGWMTLGRSHLLVFNGSRSITVARDDGRLVARTEWRPPRLHSDAGVGVAADGRAFAFRLSDVRAGDRSGTATVYVLRAGATHATAVYRHRLGPSGCAVGAGLSWHGRSLLYSSSDGRDAIIEPGARRTIDLTAFTQKLPKKSPGEQPSVYWRSDLPR
jgi:hypothetical protein